jgi:hypothetical protein
MELPIEPLIAPPFLQINFPRRVVPQVPSTLSPLALLYEQASPGDLPEQAARRASRVAFAASAPIAGASAAQAKKAAAISSFRLMVLSLVVGVESGGAGSAQQVSGRIVRLCLKVHFGERCHFDRQRITSNSIKQVARRTQQIRW